MNKMVINHLEKLFVTNDAATIIKELDIIHPAAKIAVLASEMQEQEVSAVKSTFEFFFWLLFRPILIVKIGDGTNFTIVFCGELLQNAETLIRKGLHPSDIILGYNKALERSLKILDGTVIYHSLINIS